MNKSFRKLKRMELVELIYQLRKDNLAQRKRCEELEKQLAKTEEQLKASMAGHNSDRLQRIEGMLSEMYSQSSRRENDDAMPEERSGQE